jgi:hypothetical protein
MTSSYTYGTIEPPSTNNHPPVRIWNKSIAFVLTAVLLLLFGYLTHLSHQSIDQLKRSQTSAPLEAEDVSWIASQFSENPYVGQDKLELILSGKFMIINVLMTSDEDIYGDFCEFNFVPQQEDLSLVPRFIDLHQTLHCQEHHVTLPLLEVARACRERDEGTKTHSIEPNAFIFHQPKSGSTLLTNMIAASQPGSRLISESSAVGNILGCNKCTHGVKMQALQDAVYMLSRSTSTMDEHLHIKFSATSTAGLSVVRESFPDTTWLFVYRDADIILQKLMNHRIERRICGEKKRRNPGAAMSDFLLSQDKDIAKLETAEQVCAAFLATNMATVNEELDRPDNIGRLVEYDQDLMSREGIQKVLEYLKISPDWDRIEEQRQKQANGGRGQEWTGESELTVSHEVKSATAEFCLQLDIAATSKREIDEFNRQIG